MKETTRTVYEAEDGKTFTDRKECERYEAGVMKRQRVTTYWLINHTPDLTEGRGFYRKALVECYGPEPYHAPLYMEDWCQRTYGRRLDFIMGVQPTEGWQLHKTDRETYHKRVGDARVGDTRNPPEQLYLVVGPQQTGLVEGKRE